MIVPETEHSIVNRHGDVLYSTVTTPLQSADGGLPLLLLLHGFKGFRNYSFIPWLSQFAAHAGAIAVRMCFSLNGMKNTSWLVQATDDFARNTISRECDDVADLVDALCHHEEFANLRRVWNGKISVLGHSRGGGIAMIASSELLKTHQEQLHHVAVWNSVGTWTRWTPRQAATWKGAGTFEMQNQRTLQTLNMHSTYLVDIEENAPRLDLVTASSALSGKLRYVHAQHDLTVPLREIELLAQASRTEDSITIIGNTTHTFGMEHPVSRITRGFADAIEATFPWVVR